MSILKKVNNIDWEDDERFLKPKMTKERRELLDKVMDGLDKMKGSGSHQDVSLVFTNGEVVNSPKHGCYGFLQSLYGAADFKANPLVFIGANSVSNYYKTVYTLDPTLASLPPRFPHLDINYDLRLEFLNWLVNESLWRKIFMIKDAEVIMKRGSVFSCHYPFRFMSQGMFAERYAVYYDYIHILDNWKILKEIVNPNIAWIIAMASYKVANKSMGLYNFRLGNTASYRMYISGAADHLNSERLYNMLNMKFTTPTAKAALGMLKLTDTTGDFGALKASEEGFSLGNKFNMVESTDSMGYKRTSFKLRLDNLEEDLENLVSEMLGDYYYDK